jgi:hypothetical protein
MRVASRTVLLVLLSTLAACSALHPDEAIVADARGVLDAIARRDLDAVTSRLDEKLRGPLLGAQLDDLANHLPKTPPTRFRVVGFSSSTMDIVGGSKTRLVDVTFESNYPDLNIVSEIAFRQVDDGPRKIVSLHVNPAPAPLEVLNAFTFSNKGPLHFAFLIAMFVVAGTTIAALVMWKRRRSSLRHPWRWLLAILLGAFNFTLNWTTGALGVQFLTLQVASLGFVRAGEVGPWVLTVAIPAGAIAFLASQRRERPPATPAPSAGPPPVGSPPSAPVP